MTATEASEVCQQGWMKAALDALIDRQIKNSNLWGNNSYIENIALFLN